MSIEILRELGRCDFLTPAILHQLTKEGVDLDALKIRWEGLPQFIPRREAVVYLDNGAFEFGCYRRSDPPTGAIIFPVHDELGDLIDLCAWSPPRPPALWRATGCMLGAERLFGPRMQEALPVHRTVLNWLRANCGGVVIFDEPKSADLLRRAAPLAAEDEGHGDELERLLKVIPPQIYVPCQALGRSA
jgi:hypothetical protein